jgi:hypothetical protein
LIQVLKFLRVLGYAVGRLPTSSVNHIFFFGNETESLEMKPGLKNNPRREQE